MVELINTKLIHINTDPFLLFFGSFYLVLGLSCFFAKKPWEEFIKLFIEHDALSLVLGILTLPISLSIIAFYNNWETIPSIILMSLGYLVFFISVILLMFPKVVQNFLKREFVHKWLWLDGLSGMVLGVAMLVL